MILDTNIQKAVRSIEGNPKLDRAVKELLADKQVLARILKRVTDEFKDEEIDTIMEAIEGEPDVSSVPAEPGLTNAPAEATKLAGESTESNIQGEGIYYFDIRFSARLPENKRLDFGIRIIVDLEGQYTYFPGYDVVTRGVFYAARMISSQSGTEFVGDDFGNMRKVYSVWLCMDPPDYAEDSIVRFHIAPEVMHGKFPEEKIAEMKYDLLDVVLVFISTGKNTEKDELCGMLGVLLDETVDKEDRLRTLEKDYGMKRTYELERGLDKMCDYSIGIAKKHFLQGVADGEKQGGIRGIEEGQSRLVDAIQRLREGKTREEILASG
ncbi:MAG: hypothetical protein IJ733_09525, partial [Lachnospiraceae bacterium]|nr:hypothetical protein [Lachnospiraceae bacterium]